MKVISFEGFEYSGKSTQIKLLKKYFIKNKIKSTFTREPGGNKDLEKIRNIIIKSNFDNLSLIMFFFASRFSLLSSLKNNDLTVFDRFFDSTYAYQKYNLKEKKLIISLINLIDQKFIPNITFYLKLDKKNLMERKNKRVYSNKFDKKYFGQFSRIQKNYNEISKMKIGKRKFVTIDASLSANEIHEKIIVHLKKCKLIR
jgi:dTMP kinase|tara:strand:+ start:161 stop:760 length:600 start_codon:yes stop_codon:yes gene_type:complete